MLKVRFASPIGETSFPFLDIGEAAESGSDRSPGRRRVRSHADEPPPPTAKIGRRGRGYLTSVGAGDGLDGAAPPSTTGRRRPSPVTNGGYPPQTPGPADRNNRNFPGTLRSAGQWTKLQRRPANGRRIRRLSSPAGARPADEAGELKRVPYLDRQS